MSKDNKTQVGSDTAEKLYERLKADREPYTKRAEDCAAMTIPALFPKESDSSSTDYMTPNQSIGARGVNNLSSKLLLALLPPNAPFFRLGMSEKVRIAELEQGGQDRVDLIEQELSKIENVIMRYIETSQIRVTVKEALNQLIVAGNACLLLPPNEGGAKLYRLNNYVVQRDALGNVIQLITVDSLAYATLPDEAKALVASDGGTPESNEKVLVYTHVYLSEDGKEFHSYQEVKEKRIPNSENTFPRGKTPWIPLRLTKVDGEHYGRSYVEEYLGDLETADGQTEAVRNFAAISSHVLFMVNPTGLTQVRQVAKAKSGAFVPGRAEDIVPLATSKLNDMSVTTQFLSNLEQRLGYIFLLNSAVQRKAERVTAEEIRYVAGELEDTLGGTYSILSQEFQLPLVRRLMAQLTAQGELPSLPEGSVEPSITTGLEALGRGHDLNKLMLLQQTFQIPGVLDWVNIGTWLQQLCNSNGINTEGLIKSKEQKQAEDEAAQQAMLAQQAVVPMINQMGEQQQ